VRERDNAPSTCGAARIDERWRTDGTPSGTTLAANIESGGSDPPQTFTNLSGSMLFTADDGVHGTEIWKFVPQ
jgi:ELWxxDGT repeat protein